MYNMKPFALYDRMTKQLQENQTLSMLFTRHYANGDVNKSRPRQLF